MIENLVMQDALPLTSLVILMNCIAASSYMLLLLRASVLKRVARVANIGFLKHILLM